MIAHIRRDVAIPFGHLQMKGMLDAPAGAAGLVLLAQSSESERHNARNEFVARQFHGAGFATLMLDLLDEQDAEDRGKAFDIDALANRLEIAARWAREQPETAALPFGYFANDTVAAAVLVAAALRPDHVDAVALRAGQLDLADAWLPQVQTPTLLIAPGDDDAIMHINRHASARLDCEHELIVIFGATHCFAESGALKAVADHAITWFQSHLARRSLAEAAASADASLPFAAAAGCVEPIDPEC
jgi:putative phosphoribosyl transferase